MYNNSDVSVMGISQYYFTSKDHHWITKKPYENHGGGRGRERERERARFCQTSQNVCQI